MQLLCVFSRALRGSGARQSETENGAPIRIGAGPEATVMRFDNSTADIQPHAQPFGLGAVERFKEAVRVFEAVAAIKDRQFYDGALVGNDKPQTAVLALFHGFDPVLEQVQ